MKTLNTRAVVEGAVLAAVTALMGIFYRVPILEALNFFWPVPIILVGYRNGFKISMISAAVAAFVIGIIINPITALILLLVYALPGAIMGMLMKRKISPYITIFAGGMILAFNAVLEMAIMLEMILGRKAIEIIMNFGKSIDDYHKYILNIGQSISAVYKQFGVDAAVVQQTMDVFEAAVTASKTTLPAGLLLMGIFVAFINFKVVRLILGRMGHSIENINKFSKWRFNESFKVPILIFTAITLALSYIDFDALRSISTNLYIILIFTFGVLGLSVTVYFMEKLSAKYEIPRPLLILFIVPLLLIFRFIFPLIGMFDLTADIRRNNKNIHGGVR